MSASDKLTSHRNLTKVFGMEEFMDVVLEVPTYPEVSWFGCHRIKLAEASKTLKEKLLSKKLSFDEKGNTYLFVNDVAMGTLLKVLRHIYNEEIPEDEMDDELLEAARHLQMDDLVKSCLLAAIPTQLTLENVSKALDTAYKLDLPKVKKNALKFIWNHLKDISSVESFKNLVRKNPNLMTDILVEAKLSAFDQGQLKEEKEVSFTTEGPNSNEGMPVLLGAFTMKNGIQVSILPTVYTQHLHS